MFDENDKKEYYKSPNFGMINIFIIARCLMNATKKVLKTKIHIVLFLDI